MSIVMGALILVVFTGGVAALAKWQNQASPKTKKSKKAKKFKGGGGKSHVVTFLNSTGATNIKSRKLSHAAAEVAGKGTGKAVRASGRGVKKAVAPVGRGAFWVGSKWKELAAARWNRRVVSDGHQPLIWRDRTSLIDGDKPDPPCGAGWRSDDGSDDLTCGKPAGRHLFHKDLGRGRLFVGAPGGAISWTRTKDNPENGHSPATTPATDKLVAGRKDPAPTPRPTTLAAARPKPSVVTAIIPGGSMTASAESTRAIGRTAVPPYFAQLVGYVANFEPEDDKDLIRFMADQAAGISAYAEAMVQAHETCLRSIGLDPAAISGLADYADTTSESGVVMTRAHRKFLAVYNEVLQAVANGVLLPRNGRFITGQAS